MPQSHNSQVDDTIFGAAQAGQPWPIACGLEIKLLIAIVAAQVAILVGMIALDGLPLVLGERVKLKVVPVDPRDLFRGDYVVLGYDFSRFDPASFSGAPASARVNGYSPEWVGREVFVSLKPVGDHHEADGKSLKPPTSGPYLRGIVSNAWSNRIDFGIEAYYVQEGEGRRLERLIRERQLMAEVAVWHGHAKLVRLVE
jgi:uncharacterized membrane-anchored protein